MRGLLALAPIVFLAACTAAAPSLAGDAGDELGATTSHVSKGCSASRDQLLANAGTTRAEAISRGFEWLDANVPYSQSAQHEGYRTDCSGFVSMCWGLKQSYTTADFAAGTADNTILGSYEDLQPGDGLVRRSGGAGHAVLFVGWDDDAHENACVLEEASTASDMQFGVRTVASLKSQGFKAMRADGMPDAEPAVAAAGDDDTEPGAADVTEEPAGTVEPETPAPRAAPKLGDACSDDDGCNPLVTGTGLVCDRSAGKCVAGCKVDLHCPGSLLCKAGSCQ
ncbi:MAG: hypothetical protein U0270_38430 [Labilithrix sp.]